MRNTYRDIFIEMVRQAVKTGEIKTSLDVESILCEVEKKSWNVRMEYPTRDTEVIEKYLSKYVNRTAISKRRLKYVAKKEKTESYVELQYKDYRRQKKGEAATYDVKRMHPLVAIYKFTQHVLPPYFQKTRHYGLHSPATYKRIKDKIPQAIKNNKDTIKKIFELLTQMNGLTGFKCEHCEGEDFEVTEIRPDKNWVKHFLNIPSYRGPPKIKREKVVQF